MMNEFKDKYNSGIAKIILKPGKNKSVQRRHPWVFSGAIAKKDRDLTDGDCVEVYDSEKNYMATGHYQNNTISVRIFSFEKCIPDELFWMKKMQAAIDFRKSIFLPTPQTNMYRLVNGEGDGFPGLIVDVYNNHAVLQVHSVGMLRISRLLTDVIVRLLPETKAVYLKNAIDIQENSDERHEEGWIYGSPDPKIVAFENGIAFVVDIENGQKTGFFLDQRDSRAIVGDLAKGRTMLNMFSYSGGFSLYALQNGANHVDSVDISQKAINLVDENVSLLTPDLQKRHTSRCEDVFEFLDQMDDDYYDLIVLDPPAFAKHHRVKEQGIKGYRNINKKTMEKIRKGGFLFTFSCSQAISRDDFQTIVFSAAALAGKSVRIVKRLQHAADHPVSVFHPEGEYLKGLMLYVES